MNKFKLAQIAADYAAERHQEAATILLQDKFIKIDIANYLSFLRYCVTTPKQKTTFYQSIRRSVEEFHPFYIEIASRRGTKLKIFTFNNFNTFLVQKDDINVNTKKLLKKWEIKIMKEENRG